MKTPMEIEWIKDEISDVKTQLRDIEAIANHIDMDLEVDSWLETLDKIKEQLLRQEQRLQVKLKVTRRKIQESGVKY